MTKEDCIFDFIYSAAVGDATKQKAYIGKKGWIQKVYNARTAVKEYIDYLLDAEKTLDEKKHKELFETTVRTVVFTINNKKEVYYPRFTFGNAQKLVNITAKFFYITCYKNENLKERFKFCHCPMDNFMLEQIWQNRENLENFEYKQKGKFVGLWSKLDFDNVSGGIENWSIPKRYEDFQKAISELSEKEKILPIEYDYIHWKSDNK